MSDPNGVGPDLHEKPTVTSTGESVLKSIDGVIVRTPVTHVDHRGALFEIFNGDPELWPDPVVYAYQTSIFPGVVKGWFRHEVKTDRYTIVDGEITVLLYDGREDSPTHGLSQRISLSPRSARQVVIPVGIWHLLFNPGPEEAQLINMPTAKYRHDRPDRLILPWDSPEIPVDVRGYLPQF